MTGFATVPDALRAAGKAAADAVSALRGADCGIPVADLAAALPGSASAGAATGYADGWSSTFTGWCASAEQHAANLTTAADTYSTTEQDNTHLLDPNAGRMRGPR